MSKFRNRIFLNSGEKIEINHFYVQKVLNWHRKMFEGVQNHVLELLCCKCNFGPLSHDSNLNLWSLSEKNLWSHVEDQLWNLLESATLVNSEKKLCGPSNSNTWFSTLSVIFLGQKGVPPQDPYFWKKRSNQPGNQSF